MSSAAIRRPYPLFFLLFFSSALSVAPYSFAMGGAAGEEGDFVARESFTIAGDIAWVVQVSDLHISAYHPDRARDLAERLGPALRVIRPALLLVTGDITDAKNERRTSTRQDESEWIQYRDTVDAIIDHSGIDRHRIFDIRGNHDKYGVPYVGDTLDYFSNYSVSAQLKRLSTIQSIALMGDDTKYIFIGIDDTVNIGIRGPSNLFGHPTEERIAAVEAELQFWDDYPGAKVAKIVYGHFPMSFTTSTERGERYENVFARQTVSSYICGHLHATFGDQLWRLHRAKMPKSRRSFWEWEVGDWKDHRFIRILAIDGGVVSFRDIKLLKKDETSEDFATTILITYPVDSTSMNTDYQNDQPIRNDINVLVFSDGQVLNVTAKIFDSSKDFKIVEEIPLQQVGSGVDQPLFHNKWDAKQYLSKLATQYFLQITVFDSKGVETKSELRPISVEGKLAQHQNTWLAYLVLEVQWENLYLVLLWCNFALLIVFLALPKILNYCMKRNASYQKWAMSVSISSRVQQKKSLFWILWFLIEGSRSTILWFSSVIYLISLLVLPWFWGHATSENGDMSSMYLWGWTVQLPNRHLTLDKLANPDIFAITLPFMYLVVAPMLILVHSLFAERTAAYLQFSRKLRVNVPEPLDLDALHESQSDESSLLSSSANRPQTSLASMVCGGWERMLLLSACAIVILIHLKLCSNLMLSYGAGPVSLSPVFTWAPLVIFAAAIYSTSDFGDAVERKRYSNVTVLA